ncbi:MAG: hypothetical protein V7750_16785 [Sneathiella sp.]
MIILQNHIVFAENAAAPKPDTQTIAAEYLECAVLVFASQNLFSNQEDKISAMMNASKLASKWMETLLLSEAQASKILIARIDEVKAQIDSKEAFEENYNNVQQHLCAGFVKEELWG